MKNNRVAALDAETVSKIREQFNQCGPMFLALGDAVRQDILMMLSEQPETGMNVSEITARTNLSRPAVSHHLKILKTAGFLGSRKNRTQVYYFITLQNSFPKLKELVLQLDKLAKARGKK